jgi:hypothetical protein
MCVDAQFNYYFSLSNFQTLISGFSQGFASGYLWTDNVTMAGYNVSSQGFAVCNQLSNGLLSGNVTGLMGRSCLFGSRATRHSPVYRYRIGV